MLDDYAALVGDGVVWVLTAGATIQGLVVLRDEADHLLLENVAVAPEFQGRGLGGRLLEFAEDQARARGYGEIRLYTNEAMTENIALYHKRGYHETSRETGAYRRVFMSKPV